MTTVSVPAANFTATSFHTAEDKAWFTNALIAFVIAGFPRSRFTSRLYQGLSTSGYFGFIAHFNLDGFYDAQMSTQDRRLRFLIELRRSCAEHADTGRYDLWSDVKEALLDRDWLTQQINTTGRALAADPRRRILRVLTDALAAVDRHTAQPIFSDYTDAVIAALDRAQSSQPVSAA